MTIDQRPTHRELLEAVRAELEALVADIHRQADRLLEMVRDRNAGRKA